MPEPLYTETVGASLSHQDRAGQPFLPKGADVHVSLGIVEDVYSIARKQFLKETVNTVKPVIPEFEKISSAHGRSMTEIATSKKLVWGGDLPGDVFGARTVKGTAMNTGKKDTYRLRYQKHAGYEVDALGLMDDGCVGRVIKASELMRKNGLPTEKPVAVKKLKEIFVLKEKSHDWVKVPIKEWERIELERMKKLYEEGRGPKSTAVEKYLRETDFIALERDVQVDERMVDLMNAVEANNLKEFLVPIFKWLNAAIYTKGSGLIPGTPKPDVFEYNRQDLLRYFQEFLPQQMGAYLGRFHRLGLRHGFLHDQNWSAVGTIYDLDSVEGTALYSDDTRSNPNHFAQDLGDSHNSLMILSFDLPGCDNLHGTYSEEIKKTASNLFLHSYFIQKYGPDFSESQLTENEAKFLAARNYSYQEIIGTK